MKKVIITVVVFAICQIAAYWWVLSRLNFNATTDEVDMEIYEFEHEEHQYMIFEEDGRTISVIHNPNCDCRLHDVK